MRNQGSGSEKFTFFCKNSKTKESSDYQHLVGELQKEYLKEVESDEAQELQNEVCVCSCLTKLKGMVYTILERLFKPKRAFIVPTTTLICI
jgi:hypothetical protein